MDIVKSIVNQDRVIEASGEIMDTRASQSKALFFFSREERRASIYNYDASLRGPNHRSIGQQLKPCLYGHPCSSSDYVRGRLPLRAVSHSNFNTNGVQVDVP